MSKTFGEELLFSFVFRSVSRSPFRPRNSDMDTFVSLINPSTESAGVFIDGLRHIHEKFDLRVDEDLPSEVAQCEPLSSGISHLYHQLYGINYEP